MSASALALSLAVGGAALALWVDVRFPSLAAPSWRRVLAHLLASMLVIRLVMPGAAETVIDLGTRLAYPLAAVGVALPALTYVFLASLWCLKLTQRGLMR